MVNVITLTLGQLETNCYLATCNKTKQTLIIDPADQGDLISQKVLEEKLKPIAIVLTHGHFDHVLALLELKLNFNLPIYLHPKDNKLLATANKSASHWLGNKVDPVPPADLPLVDQQAINFGEEQLTILHTPGHTPGSICLYQPSILFTGDTLFKDGVGRTDFSYSNKKDLDLSLKKIFKLPKTTTIFPGHGEAVNLSEISPQL